MENKLDEFLNLRELHDKSVGLPNHNKVENISVCFDGLRCVKIDPKVLYKYTGTYSGYVCDGSPDGFGAYNSFDGEIEYIGEWTDGTFNGWGKLTKKDAYIYVGHFANGNTDGRALVITSDHPDMIIKGLFTKDCVPVRFNLVTPDLFLVCTSRNIPSVMVQNNKDGSCSFTRGIISDNFFSFETIEYKLEQFLEKDGYRTIYYFPLSKNIDSENSDDYIRWEYKERNKKPFFVKDYSDRGYSPAFHGNLKPAPDSEYIFTEYSSRKNDKLEGKQIRFYGDGTIEKSYYKNGELNGDVIKKEADGCYYCRFYENGELKYKEKLSNNSLNEYVFSDNVCIDKLCGLNNVKKFFKSLKTEIAFDKKNSKATIAPKLLFIGNPGTGKTEVAKILSESFYNLGLTQSPDIVEKNASDFIGEYANTIRQNTTEILNQIVGKTLFIDEAYTLIQDKYGQQVIEPLMAFIEEHRYDTCVIFAGYPEEMEQMLKSNPGLRSRFTNIIKFEDYNNFELREIFLDFCAENDIVLDFGASKELNASIKELLDNKNKNFGNAREIRNMFDSVFKNVKHRYIKDGLPVENLKIVARDFEDIDIYGSKHKLLTGDINDKKDSASIAKLNSLIGLEQIKEDVIRMIKQISINKRKEEMGAVVRKPVMHMIFTGNPGTGKTEVARLIGKIYRDLGLLSSDKFIEVQRSDLVAGYTGQTALKVAEVIEKAIGGVLFVDEAYALVQGENDSFGKEALDALLKPLEDNRDNLMIIFAGYDKEMENLLEANPGLKSRFGKILHFDDYTEEELISIFKLFSQQYTLDEDAEQALRNVVHSLYINRDKNFGNARTIRTLFEKVEANQNERLYDEDVDDDNLLFSFTSSDFANIVS